MKVIDLLNKIANGEEVPKKIRITDIGDRYTTHYNFFYDEDDQEYKDDELFPLGARLILDRVLNEKVEIIEDTPKKDKINELSDYQICQENYYKIIDKINEIIDRLNGKEDEKRN